LHQANVTAVALFEAHTGYGEMDLPGQEHAGRAAMLLNSSVNLAAFAESKYARQLNDGFSRLHFPADLEKQYLVFHLARIRGRVKAFVLLLPILVILQNASQAYLDAHAGFAQYLLTASPLLGFLLACNLLVWSRQFWKFYLPAATALTGAILLLSCYLLPTAHLSGEMLSVEFILNVPAMTYIFLGLPFYRASIINALSMVVFFVSMMLGAHSSATLVVCLSSIPPVCAAAAVMAYLVEHASREHFLQQRLLGEIASHDALTGLHNRGVLDEQLERLWNQGCRTGEILGLLMVDIDHFKCCNDSRGHQAGDECLKKLAEVLKPLARKPLDIAARYGGEEFALVLFPTTRAHVLAVAESLRVQIESLALPNPGAPARIITVSVGAAAVMPAGEESVRTFVELADQALYGAKQEGRNRVRMSEQESLSADADRFQRRSFMRVVK
jgi:diguanylate cyclase (GGDEF)-like protein